MASNNNTAFLGNLSYNQGADFNVVVCDATFEELKQYDEWASSEVNGGRTQNGMGENIKNCFIVCAPQTTADVNYISYVQTTSYTDLTGNYQYDDGKDSDYNTDTYTYISSIGATDKGDYDLLVTDHLGNLIRLTPPFADYDTRYFDVVSPNNDDTNSKYGSRYLTFNSDYQKLLGDTNTIVTSLATTYTPILETIDEYEGNNLAKKNITMVYTYAYVDDEKTTHVSYGTFSYNALMTNDGRQYSTSGISSSVKEFLHDKYPNSYNADKASTYVDWDDSDAIKCLVTYCNPHRVSFVDLLQKIDELTYKCTYLQNVLDSNGIGDASTYEKGSDNGATYYWTYTYTDDGTEIAKKVYTIDGRLTKIENSNILFRADKSIPSYLWSGNNNEYNEFANTHAKDMSTYIFLHTV